MEDHNNYSTLDGIPAVKDFIARLRKDFPKDFPCDVEARLRSPRCVVLKKRTGEREFVIREGKKWSPDALIGTPFEADESELGGYWVDLLVLYLARDNTLHVTGPKGGAADARHLPTDDELATIQTAAQALTWAVAEHFGPDNLPERLKEKEEDKDYFVIDDKAGNRVMIQERIEWGVDDNGKVVKDYLPWSWFGETIGWLKCEPNGLVSGDLLLPYGLGLVPPGVRKVMIHEGAKAADGAQRAARDPAHPWFEHLSEYAHLGWIGGAPSPHRTYWGALAEFGFSEIIIVPDNDAIGRWAAPRISRALAETEARVGVFYVPQFEFPDRWDFADPMPPDLFKEIGEGEEVRTIWTGEGFLGCIYPATWATQREPIVGKGRPSYSIRRRFAEEFVPIRLPDRVGVKWPVRRTLDREDFNRLFRPFSDVEDTARLLLKEAGNGIIEGVTFSPGLDKPITLNHERKVGFNVWNPTHVQPEEGDVAPWLQFLADLFPKDLTPYRDRTEATRWMRTLIGRPEIHMQYGMCMISKPGTGKSTLMEEVLAPCVGWDNAVLVSGDELKDKFNGYAEGRRLIYCHELYEGHGWGLANKLKSLITDPTVKINNKFEKPYTVRNGSQVCAASNHMEALRIDGTDRRWLFPYVSNVAQSREYYGRFRRWLKEGGLSAILWWARSGEAEDYVKPGEWAPDTEMKHKVVEEGRSEAGKIVQAIGERGATLGQNDDGEGEVKPLSLMYADIRDFVKNRAARVVEGDDELIDIACAAGMVRWTKQIKVEGHLQRFIVNGPLLAKLEGFGDDEAGKAEKRKAIREARQTAEELMKDWRPT